MTLRDRERDFKSKWRQWNRRLPAGPFLDDGRIDDYVMMDGRMDRWWWKNDNAWMVNWRKRLRKRDSKSINGNASEKTKARPLTVALKKTIK